MNRWWWNFWCAFLFSKKNIERCPNFLNQSLVVLSFAEDMKSIHKSCPANELETVCFFCIQYFALSYAYHINNRHNFSDMFYLHNLYIIGEGNLIFCCTGPTDRNFWQIKITIILISHTNFSFFYNWYFFQYDIFLLDHNKIRKNKKFSAFDIVEWPSTEMWSVSYVTCVDIIAQVFLTRWSIFLYLDFPPTLKLRIIILSTDRPDIILPTARTAKN